MNTTPIRFAVIGCGHIGKRHAEMISRNDDSELVALVDLKPKESLGLEAYKDIPFFSSIEAFLESPLAKNTDVVNLATPNGYHSDQALLVLDAGCHVVIEKPMALSKAKAEQVIYRALKMQKQVFCVMQNRFSPPSAWLKEMVMSGALGDIYQVQLNCYWNRDDRYYKKDSWHGSASLDGGVLYTQFSHFIDLMYWLFGDISNINAKLVNHNHHDLTELEEDSGIVLFDFIEHNALGTMNFSTSVWDKNLESSMTVIAEKGSIKVGGQYMDKVEICHVDGYQMPELPPTNPGNDYGAYKGSAANHHYVIENIVEVLKGTAPISVNALEGLKVVEIIEKIYEKAHH